MEERMSGHSAPLAGSSGGNRQRTSYYRSPACRLFSRFPITKRYKWVPCGNSCESQGSQMKSTATFSTGV